MLRTTSSQGWSYWIVRVWKNVGREALRADREIYKCCVYGSRYHFSWGPRATGIVELSYYSINSGV